MDISVIIPLFNEEESLQELFAWIKRVMDSNDFTYGTAIKPSLSALSGIP